jgi:hypothetical protein
MAGQEKEPDLTPWMIVGAVVLGAAMFPQIVLPVLAGIVLLAMLREAW